MVFHGTACNYLYNKSKYVVYNGAASEYKIWYEVFRKVLGPILGPIIFIEYINDLANISNKFEFILFVDDTNVFLPVNIEDVKCFKRNSMKN